MALHGMKKLRWMPFYVRLQDRIAARIHEIFYRPQILVCHANYLLQESILVYPVYPLKETSLSLKIDQTSLLIKIGERI